MSKSLKHVPQVGRPENYACGYKSLNVAIINAQDIGARLLGKVKPENLFFFFGETVQSLQSGILNFCDRHFIAYPSEDCYAPIHSEQDAGKYHYQAEPLAVVLCKVIDSKGFEPFFRAEHQKGGDYSKRYEITWGELQCLKQVLDKISAHENQSNIQTVGLSSDENKRGGSL